MAEAATRPRPRLLRALRLAEVDQRVAIRSQSLRRPKSRRTWLRHRSCDLAVAASFTTSGSRKSSSLIMASACLRTPGGTLTTLSAFQCWPVCGNCCKHDLLVLPALERMPVCVC